MHMGKPPAGSLRADELGAVGIRKPGTAGAVRANVSSRCQLASSMSWATRFAESAAGGRGDVGVGVGGDGDEEWPRRRLTSSRLSPPARPMEVDEKR